MADTFEIKLTGRPLPGQSREATAIALAVVMNIRQEQALGLLAGRETVVKRQLDADAVPRYLQAIEAAGAEVRAERSTPAATAPVETPIPTPRQEEEVPSPEEVMHCPACGAAQPKRNLCRECGADMPRLLAAQATAAQDTAIASPFAPPTAKVRDVADDQFEPQTPAPFGLSFAGRIGRVRYLAYGLPVYVLLFVAGVIGGIVGGVSGSTVAAGLFITLGVLGALVIAIRMAVLRLHDLNLSGRWLYLPIGLGILSLFGGPTGFLALATVVGLGSLALLLVPGSKGFNNFGPPAGPNTVWTMIGAIAVVVLGLVGNSMSPDRFAPAADKSPVPELGQ